MRKFYKAGKVRLVCFVLFGKYYVTAIKKTRFDDYQRQRAASIGTVGASDRQIVFATARKRSRFLRKIRAKIDWVMMWWWYIG